MTVRTESRIIIARRIDEVWSYLCDVERWREWAPTVLECRMRDHGPLRPGTWIEQKAKDYGWVHHRSEQVTVLDPPHFMAFAGTMGSSAARWGMELSAEGDERTNSMMWVEIDIANIMRAIPRRALQSQVQRVSNVEMAAIKAAVEHDAHADGGRP
ncbi:SRPBCC family protein [Humibacter ginsengisoli]